MVSVNVDNAGTYAQRAAYATGEDAMPEAVGNGLAAIANALLEVAEQLELLRTTIEERGARPGCPAER